LKGTIRLLRAAVISLVGATTVLLAPGVAAADSGTAQQECIWLWWIPFPCHAE
jgi:hypothetical protein